MNLDGIGEKCAVFGIYSKDLEASRLTYFGLYSLQHRGQEASGISVTDGHKIDTHKSLGLVSQVYNESILSNLNGPIAIGQNRYSTSGGSGPEHNQPVANHSDIISIAHNGNIPDTKKLELYLKAKGIDTTSFNDTELIHALIKYYLVKGNDLMDSIKKSCKHFTGAFSIVGLTKDSLFAFRDPYGIRPLSIGRLKGGYVISSETCAFNTINAKYIRDVEPGEIVVINKQGLSSVQFEKSNQKLDIFELVYFSRPDSTLLGRSVYQVRKNLGIELAKEYPIDADIVIPVPDSAIPAAIGYSAYSGIPFETGLIKNRYIGRTFILPDQALRDKGVQMKLHPLKEILNKKDVIIIDDSIVRGTTSKKLVTMIRQAGARKVHLMSSCPPVVYPDFYGIDTPSQNELIAAQVEIKDINNYIGADTLSYLSYNGLIKATGLPESVFCTSCFTGNYPIDIGTKKKEIRKVKTKRTKQLHTALVN